jgi:hypothetical protein
MPCRIMPFVLDLRDDVLSLVIVILSYAFRFANDTWFIPSMEGVLH